MSDSEFESGTPSSPDAHTKWSDSDSTSKCASGLWRWRGESNARDELINGLGCAHLERKLCGVELARTLWRGAFDAPPGRSFPKYVMSIQRWPLPSARTVEFDLAGKKSYGDHMAKRLNSPGNVQIISSRKFPSPTQQASKFFPYRAYFSHPALPLPAFEYLAFIVQLADGHWWTYLYFIGDIDLAYLIGNEIYYDHFTPSMTWSGGKMYNFNVRNSYPCTKIY